MTISKLTRAVAKQVGGMETLKNIAADVCNHGADAGFNGFIYYSDTANFYQKNKPVILELLAEMAADMGESSIALVKSFNCVQATEGEIGATLYASKAHHSTNVSNALAWFALEEICRSITNN
jgi:hypothetical protein